MKELKDTIEFMTSDKYKERLMAEYWQTKIRYEKLRVWIAKRKADPAWDLTVPMHVITSQEEAMNDYLRCLEECAAYLNMDLYKS